MTGREKVGTRDAIALVATPAEGTPTKMYFDAETGLLVRQSLTRETPQGPMDIDVFLEDYRDVEGTKQPFTVRQITTAFSMLIRITEIKHNVRAGRRDLQEARRAAARALARRLRVPRFRVPRFTGSRFEVRGSRFGSTRQFLRTRNPEPRTRNREPVNLGTRNPGTSEPPYLPGARNARNAGSLFALTQ